MIENSQKGARTADAVASRREVGARGAALGRDLRQMYRDVTQEPIPAEFRKLLEQLDSNGGK
ncbi:NepR family anti-sigma factor [Parvibaculum sp.]|uniref:NepR family anti-sigma factor n=1 Tax=Parvibaculum sp. TaxID=2024848 RepID=UPI00391CEB84